MIIDSPRCWLQRRAATVFIACRRPINTFLLRACCRGHGWNREKHRHSYIPHPVPWIFILNYALLCLVSNRDWHCAKDTWTWLFAFDSSHTLGQYIPRGECGAAIAGTRKHIVYRFETDDLPKVSAFTPRSHAVTRNSIPSIILYV